MSLKTTLGKSVRLSSYFVIPFLICACMALIGCSKNCTDYEKELNAYADGSKPLDNDTEVLKKCQEARAKCPALAVIFEVMGDINAKNNEIEAADKNYEMALALQKNNERVATKKSKISETLSRSKSDAADARIESIKSMPLSQYAGLEESTRIAWCEKAINEPTRYVFPEYSITATNVPKFSGTPQQLDSLLTGLAAKDPSKPTASAAKILFAASGRGQ